MNRYSLKMRVLAPVSAALFILLTGFIYTIYQSQHQQVTDNVNRQLASVLSLFHKKVDSDRHQLLATLQMLAMNTELQTAWQQQDRQRLLDLSSPYLDTLHDEIGITHFYYHGRDRTSFLRVYNPEQYGDVINRFTLLKAEKTGQPAGGIELGKLGTLTLRVVFPWRINGEVTGFIEIGKEIDHVIEKLHDVLDVELYVSIYKEFLDREEWEKGMQLLGRESGWDLLQSSVIINHTPAEIPLGLNQYLRPGSHRYMEMDSNLELQLGKRNFRVGVVPLFDAEDQEIGDLTVLHDVTSQVATSRKTVFLTLTLCILIGVILFGLFSKMMGTIDTELTGYRQRLEELVRERTDELSKTQASLKKAQIIARLGNWNWDILKDCFWWSEEITVIYGRHFGERKQTFDAFLSRVHQEDREKVQQAFDQALQSNGTLNIEHRIILAGGGERIVHQQAEVSRDDTGKPVTMFGTLQDVTERRQMEHAVQMSRNLESLGILAGGIAHDFNNLLTAVFCNIELAMEMLPRDNKPRALLALAEKAAERARFLTSQLLTFSKGGEPVKEITSIQRLIKDTCEFVLSGSNIKCLYTVPENAWLTAIDRGQIGQVLQNLLLNAKDAMPDGGVINIRVNNIVPSPADNLPLKEQKYLKISVADQGIGIEREILPKIFDPYFSTKEKGPEKGTGLGLAICHSVINKHRGHITVDSEPGKGTTFHLYLPAAGAIDGPEGKPATARIPDQTRQDEQRRVLLMEDEQAVVQVGQAILQQMGYDVVVAADGSEAIDLYTQAQKGNTPFAVVILDLTIRGGMGGEKTIRELLLLDSKVKAVVASGYAEDPVMANFSQYGFCAAIAKPFTAKSLRETIRAIA